MLIAWSGGADSTFLLYSALKTREKRTREGKTTEPIHSVSIIHPQVVESAKHKSARKKILEWFAAKGLHHYHSEMKLKVEGDVSARSCLLSQVAIWIPYMIQFLHVHENLYLGYIKEDVVFHRWQEITYSFDYLMRAIGKTGELKVPLEFIAKEAILARLRSCGLLKLTEFCESRKRRRCGKCPSCISHLTAQWKLSQGFIKPADKKESWIPVD